jgi:hypothetical protein
MLVFTPKLAGVDFDLHLTFLRVTLRCLIDSDFTLTGAISIWISLDNIDLHFIGVIVILISFLFNELLIRLYLIVNLTKNKWKFEGK